MWAAIFSNYQIYYGRSSRYFDPVLYWPICWSMWLRTLYLPLVPIIRGHISIEQSGRKPSLSKSCLSFGDRITLIKSSLGFGKFVILILSIFLCPTIVFWENLDGLMLSLMEWLKIILMSFVQNFKKNPWCHLMKRKTVSQLSMKGLGYLRKQEGWVSYDRKVAMEARNKLDV